MYLRACLNSVRAVRRHGSMPIVIAQEGLNARPGASAVHESSTRPLERLSPIREPLRPGLKTEPPNHHLERKQS
jgi:hypothetical protein